MEIELLSNNNYHLEIKPLPDNDFITKLEQTITKIVESEGYINYTIDTKRISTNGGNYLSTIYETDVKGSTKSGEKETNIFVKRAIDLGPFQIVALPEVYDAEVFFYNELSKIFAAVQEDANIPIKERYKMTKAYDGSNAEAIIMENLAKKGYTTYYRMDVMSLEFMEICVEHLARFHALSFVLKEKRPEYFYKKLKTLKHAMIFNNDFDNLIDTSKDAVMDRIDDELKPKVKKAYKNVLKVLSQNYGDESIKVCLCHGDYRPNNILVKLNEGEIQDIVPVDYQLMYYGSPVLDFLYLIYFSTDRNFRKSHMSDLKELYYETFRNFLKYFDLDADVVYPKSDFERVYKERYAFGPMHAIVAIPFLFGCEGHVLDMSGETSDMTLQLDDRFKDRLRGLMKDLEELGYV